MSNRKDKDMQRILREEEKAARQIKEDAKRRSEEKRKNG